MNIIDYLRRIICILDGIIFFNNMAVFLLLGSSLEKVIGSVRYVILYTGAGIAGSIISVAYYSMIGQDVLSAGASGAIFGLVGALAAIFFILQRNNDRDSMDLESF